MHAAEKANVVHRRRGIFQSPATINATKIRSHTIGGVSAKHKTVKSAMPARPASTLTLYARIHERAFSSIHPTSWPNGMKEKTNNPKTGIVSRIAAIIIGQF